MLMVLGCVALYSMANLGGWLAPQTVFGTLVRYGVSAANAGLPTLIEGLTTGLLSMLLGARPPHIGARRLVGIALIGYIMANGVTLWLPGFTALLLARFAAGIANAVLVYVTVSLIAMTSRNPDRSFAAMNIAYSIYGAIIVASLPIISPSFQGLAYLPYAAVIGALFSWSVLVMPRHILATAPLPPADVLPAHGPWRRVMFALLVCFIVPECIQTFGIFASSTGLGMAIGLSEAAVNTTLGASALISIVGPLVAAWSARRFGRWINLFLAMLAIAVANMILVTTTSQIAFRLALIASPTISYFLMSLLLAWCAELDMSGRYSSIMMGVVNVGTALSALIGGLVIDRFGMTGLPSYTIILSVCYLIPALALRIKGRNAPVALS